MKIKHLVSICMVGLITAFESAGQLFNSHFHLMNNILSSSKHQSNVFSIYNNPAVIASSGQFSGGVFMERRFLLEELQTTGLALLLPLRSANLGLAVQRSGQQSLNQLSGSLGFGKKLGEKIDLGFAFHFNALDAGLYGGASAWNGQLGLLLHPTDQFHVGIDIKNPVRTYYGESEEHVRRTITATFGFDGSDRFFSAISLRKEEDREMSIMGGILYKPIRQVSASIILNVVNSELITAIGYKLKELQLTVSSAYHPYLGFSSAAALIYQGNKK